VQAGDSLHPDVFKPEGTRGIALGTHLCAATNPPFGTKITIKDPGLLRGFELARLSGGRALGQVLASRQVSPRAPDILFLEQNIRLLKPGKGRLAFVTPYQIMSGPQTLFVREWLLRHAEILAVIDLPAETFQPHTGTKTCLLVVRRRIKPLKVVDVSEDRSIFMAIPRWIGHDRRGNLVYKRDSNGT
jgi:hypothetical protein